MSDCAMCVFKEISDPEEDGWCYMFRDQPEGSCAQFQSPGEEKTICNTAEYNVGVLLSVIEDQQEAIRLLIEKIHLDEGLDDETYYRMIAHVNRTDGAVARIMSRVNEEVRE